VDQRAGAEARLVYGAERARTRFIPASTFKIPHALFALDAGIVRDEFQVFRWDGSRRDIESWNRDQDLRSSMRNSAVWVYQQFARQLGEERERAYLRRIGYGNEDPQRPVSHSLCSRFEPSMIGCQPETSEIMNTSICRASGAESLAVDL